MGLWSNLKSLFAAEPEVCPTPQPQPQPQPQPEVPVQVVGDDPKPTVVLPERITDPFHVYRPMFDLIGHTEGTDKGDGYNETLAYGKLTGGDVNLVGMTLRDIDKLQTAMLRHPANKWNSSAIGRYQIIRTTLRGLKPTLKLSDDMLYGENMQDMLCLQLLKRRGIQGWLAGSRSTNSFLNQLALEWASLPKPDGKGAYKGQGGQHSVALVHAALTEVRKRAEG